MSTTLISEIKFPNNKKRPEVIKHRIFKCHFMTTAYSMLQMKETLFDIFQGIYYMVGLKF